MLRTSFHAQPENHIVSDITSDILRTGQALRTTKAIDAASASCRTTRAYVTEVIPGHGVTLYLDKPVWVTRRRAGQYAGPSRPTTILQHHSRYAQISRLAAKAIWRIFPRMGMGLMAWIFVTTFVFRQRRLRSLPTTPESVGTRVRHCGGNRGGGLRVSIGGG